jgi:glutamate-5-semialdehyde dehydrogenase
MIPTDKKNKVLVALSRLLSENKKDILDANKRDVSSCHDIDDSMFDRLKINEDKILGMIASVNKTIELKDPEGEVLYSYEHENGMRVANKSVAFGKILIIYESRPDVTIEASILAFKSGNKVLLKGGKESKETNKVLVNLWKTALSENDFDEDFVSYLDMNREETQNLIKNNSHNVDMIIPRG